MLDPVLEKNVVVEGGAKLIKLGDKMVDWDDNFRLFFTTKLANPHYSPEVSASPTSVKPTVPTIELGAGGRDFAPTSGPPHPVLD